MIRKTTKDLFEIYKSTSTKNDDKFLDPQHTVNKNIDRNGNGDDIFKAANIKAIDRSVEKHGHDSGEDVTSYKKANKKNLGLGLTNYVQKLVVATEEVDQINEKLDKSTKVGTYTTQNKDFLSLHRSDNDPKQHLLINRKSGDVVDGYYGHTKDVHDHLTGFMGLKGSIHENLNESLISGTRKIATFEGKDGHTAEVRHNKEWEEYQVHHYHNGKHLGEGPISYHGDDKEDAVDTAKHAVKNMHVKNGSLHMNESIQIDEVSKKSLKSYINRAVSDVEDRAYWAGRDSDQNKRPYVDYDSKKQDKRMNNINRAVNKISGTAKVNATEDTINKVYNNFISDKVKHLDERLSENIIGLTNKQQEMVIELYNSLTEENRKILVSELESDGVNEVLNFIITKDYN